MSKTYDKAEETKKIIVDDKIFVSFIANFKSLRSWISHDLYDNFDINKRLMKTNQAMGTLKHIWDVESVDIHTEYLIYGYSSESRFFTGYAFINTTPICLCLRTGIYR